MKKSDTVQADHSTSFFGGMDTENETEGYSINKTASETYAAPRISQTYTYSHRLTHTTTDCHKRNSEILEFKNIKHFQLF